MDAFKIEDISPETLDTKTTYKKDEESIEVIRQEIIVLPSYDYGRSQEQLDYETQVRNKPAVVTPNFYIGHFQITSTGSRVVSGLGFTPTYIEIYSTCSGSSGILESKGMRFGSNTYTHYNYNTTTGGKSYYATNNIVIIEDGSSGSFLNTYASFTSFDVDGFTLNVGTRNQTVECTYIAR